MPKKTLDKTIDAIDADFNLVAQAVVRAKPQNSVASPKNTAITTEVSSPLPKAMYWGKLPIGDIELDCVVLENGERVLTATSIFEAFGRSRKGMNSRLEIDGTALPPFIAAKNLKPFINQLVIDRTKVVKYLDGGRVKTGYVATLLPAMCGVYLAARRVPGVLVETQKKLADQAEVIATALAMVGIDALVDEATGYQLDRKHDALRMLLSKYIAEGLQQWILTFPDTFFAELDRLYGNAKTTARNRPQYYGKFINKYIYEPIENGYLKKKLDELNILPDGRRKAQFHRWLNAEGRTILIHQIGRVQGKMEDYKSIEGFKAANAKQKLISIAPYLFDEMNEIKNDF